MNYGPYSCAKRLSAVYPINNEPTQSLMRKLFDFIAVFVLSLATCTTAPATIALQKEAEPAPQPSTWDRSYGGADKSYDTELLRLREEIAPRFQTLEFADQVSGKTMVYNLYVPKKDDAKASYPLVLFMADGSTTPARGRRRR